MRSRLNIGFSLKYFIAFITLLSGGLPFCGMAQTTRSGKIQFTKVATLEGLKVTAILKDTYGFMWFGTENGLYRYDGYNTELINSSSINIRLSSDLVLALCEDNRKNLWIGTGNGLQKLSADRRSIKTYLTVPDASAKVKKGIYAIREISDGSLWCSCDDGYLYRSADKESFIRIPGTLIADYKNNPRIVMHIAEDNNQHVWIADNLSGFQKLSPAGKILSNFPPLDYKINFACFANKSVCFYASQQSVCTYSLQHDKFIPRQSKELMNLLTTPTRCVYQDNKGYQWLVTQTKLIRFNPVSEQAEDFTGEFMKSGASLFQVSCMYEDNNDQLWFGSYFGVFRLNNRNDIFNIISLPQGMGVNAYFSTRGIIQPAKKYLYIGSYSGFFEYDLLQKKFKEYRIKRGNKFKNPLARAVISDSMGSLWLATEGNGLLQFNTKSHVFTSYADKIITLDSTDANNVISPQNNSLLKDNEGQLWLGGYNNLYKINPLSGEVNVFTWGAKKESLASKRIMVIHQSLDKSIWVGTDYGLYHLNNGGLISHFALVLQDAVHPGLTNNLINCIYQDERGLFWLGTKGGGINVFNPSTNKVEQVYTVKDGLADDKICAILPGSKNELWISTYNGLSCLDIKRKSFRNFYVSDGLPVNEFNQGSALAAPDSTLYFGSMNGIVFFNPNKPLPAVKEPGVMLTKLIKHNGKENKIEETAIDIQALQNIKLDYKDHFFTVYFTLKDYFEYADANCQFAYKLDGIINQWQNIGATNYIQFAGLPAGKYLLRIKGMGSDGNWGEKEFQIPVVIDAAFYATKWAYAFYTLLAFAVIVIIFRFRVGRIRLQNKLQLEYLQKEKMQELDQMKSKFFTDITHEFRTPLTLIISPLEELLGQQTSPKPDVIRKQHNIIYRNAERLLRLINQLLDSAKIEAGGMNVSASHGNAGLFISQLIETFQLQAEKKNIKIVYALEENMSAKYLFDMEKLEKIVYNLLSNAIKFTPDGGSINVEVYCQSSADKNLLIIKVTDTSKGIPAQHLPFIFNRFYQVNTQYTNGSGLGLFLVKELTELMGGKAEVKSTEGKGTTFTITIPLHEADTLSPAATFPVLPVMASEEAGVVTQDVSALSESDPLILVVEDHDDLRSFIASGLQGKYRVLTAQNGKEGWQLALQELPDLVITDVAMPEMDGFTLSQLVKETPLTNHIAVILLTAKASSENRLHGLNMGANDYLTKPFNLQELHLRIGNLLSHQNKLREYWHKQFVLPDAQNTLPVNAPDAEDPFLLAVNPVLDKELSNADFTVEQLARQMTVSTRTLHRKLSSLTGMNANELIRSYRLSRAATLLKEGQPVSDVAWKVGFESLSYFSKCFKDQFSVSPSRYVSQN